MCRRSRRRRGREQVHVRHAGKVSLVNCGKSSIVISPYFAFICSVVRPPLTAIAERLVRRRHRPVPCGVAGWRLPRPECPPAPSPLRRRPARRPRPHHRGLLRERALLEDRSNRPGARRDSRQAILVRLELRERLFGRRQRHPRDCEPGARDPEKIPSVHVHAVLVLVHRLSSRANDMRERLVSAERPRSELLSSGMTTGAPSTPAPAMGDTPASPPVISTPELIGAMLDSGKGISDLVFSPGRPPQVEQQGDLAVVVPGLPLLRPEDTARIAGDLIGGNQPALQTLKEQGACDLWSSLKDRPLPRQRLPPARHLRDRDARHRVEDPDARRAEPAAGRSPRRRRSRTASCWSPGRPAPASRRRSPRSSI